jgi:hypothetical protein
MRFDRPGQLPVWRCRPLRSAASCRRCASPAMAELEGITPILEGRRRAGTTETPGREIYSRRAKALLRVGPPAAARRRSRARSDSRWRSCRSAIPCASPGARLPVRILYFGRPLAGAPGEAHQSSTMMPPASSSAHRCRGAHLLCVASDRHLAAEHGVVAPDHGQSRRRSSTPSFRASPSASISRRRARRHRDAPLTAHGAGRSG